MKIVNGAIAKATREEMYEYYLTRGWAIPFSEWLRWCEEAGTKVTDDGEDGK